MILMLILLTFLNYKIISFHLDREKSRKTYFILPFLAQSLFLNFIDLFDYVWEFDSYNI